MRRKLSAVIAALTAAFMMIPFAQSVPSSAAEITLSGQSDNTEADTEPEKNDEPALREDVEYSIVPCCAGSCSVDLKTGEQVIRLYKTNRCAAQRWKLIRSGDDYMIQNAADADTVMDIKDGTVQSGAAVCVSKRAGSDSQLWRLEYAGDGTYVIHPKQNSSYALDVYGSHTDNGTRIDLRGCHTGSNQRFRFVDLTTAVPRAEWGAERTDCAGSDWDCWDGSFDTGWYDADPNASSYQLSAAAQLAGLARLVRDGTCDFKGKTVYLTRDIDLCSIEWMPIGNNDRPFRGSFNGHGYAIVGLALTGTGDEAGFIGKFDGGAVCNFAIRGQVSGDWNVGGVCGKLESGHIVNVYSEVTITRAAGENCGGICGRIGYAGYVEHCTQNARVSSTESKPDRGGIGGYCPGSVRWCVNMQTVASRWDYVGGIAGHLVGGKIEFCANYGQVGGAAGTESAGGIFGKGEDDACVYGCFNSGYVWSTGDDYIGGIGGRIVGDTPKVFCCINTGDAKGRDYVGGILGEGNCTACLSTGYVTGSSKYGAVTGNTKYRLDLCSALSQSAQNLNGKGGSNANGAEWVTADELISGKVCADLNSSISVSGYRPAGTTFFQNLGADALPDFSGATVEKNGNSYQNKNHEVCIAVSSKDAGTVNVTQEDGITLAAEPNGGWKFAAFRIEIPKKTKRTMYNGEQECVSTETETVTESEYPLTSKLDKSYRIYADFVRDDGEPDDMKQIVKIELETIRGCGGWNSETVPVYLTDTAGKSHLWEISRTEIDGIGDKVSQTFDLGAAYPAAVTVYPNTSKKDLVLQAKLTVNDADIPVQSAQVKIQSGWQPEAMANSQYVYIPFSDTGTSRVDYVGSDQRVHTEYYDTPSKAWEAAQNRDNKQVMIQLLSPWLIDQQLEQRNNDCNVSVLLNGYPIIRSVRGVSERGGVFYIQAGASLNLKDNEPVRSSGAAFTGGSVQGGRSKNAAGLIQVDQYATFVMEGGTLYNGVTSAKGGGAIRNAGGTVELSNVLISGCKTLAGGRKDTFGGGIYTDGGTLTMKNCTIKNCRGYDHAGAIMIKDSTVTLEDVNILGCKTDDEEGGAIYIDGGTLTYRGGSISGCESADDGGAIYQESGTVLCENVRFDGNSAKKSGGALYVNSDDSTWLIGCTFRLNLCGDHGGAIYLNENNNYLEDCTVTNNASKYNAGGIYVEEDSSIDFCGKIIIRDNDGTGTMDNLVAQKGGWIYDQGLRSGSEIHVRLKSGTGDLTNKKYPISEYHMQYFRSDSGELYMKDTKEVSTRLQASVFTEGIFGRYAGAAVIAAIGVFTLILYRKKRKGEGQ